MKPSSSASFHAREKKVREGVTGPSPISAAFQKAFAHHHKGELALAQEIYEAIVRAQPMHFDALQLLGTIALQTRNPSKAVDYFNRAIAIKADHAPTHFNLALSLGQLGWADEALASYDRTIALNPNCLEAHYNRGNLLKDFRRFEAALVSYDHAIAAHPRFADAHLNRGNVLRELRRWEAAIASYDRAIWLQPGNAAAFASRGAARHGLGDIHGAIESCQHALEIDPYNAVAHINLAYSLLLSGNFASGWDHHEWRWKVEGTSSFEERREFDKPQWKGETVTGKTILVYSEQGYGDAIQMLRYVPKLLDLGASVVLELPPSLQSLAASSFKGALRIVSRGDELPPFDVNCPMMSLPRVFSDIPASPRYLCAADPDARDAWRAKLRGEGARVGLTWSGNATHANDGIRNVPLAELVRALPPGHQYVALQPDLRPGDRELLDAAGVISVSDSLHDFRDTAALCEVLDLVISVDTSVAHLGGALGTPTWVLLSFVPDWRWLLERNDSPWYPSVVLYRQASPGDWQSPLARLANDLKLWKRATISATSLNA
jgi:tetratricopeptide (TPR) repeat protein